MLKIMNSASLHNCHTVSFFPNKNHFGATFSPFCTSYILENNKNMNFLAHIYLSGNSDEISVGNFIGDYIKG